MSFPRKTLSKLEIEGDCGAGEAPPPAHAVPPSFEVRDRARGPAPRHRVLSPRAGRHPHCRSPPSESSLSPLHSWHLAPASRRATLRRRTSRTPLPAPCPALRSPLCGHSMLMSPSSQEGPDGHGRVPATWRTAEPSADLP